MCCKKEKYLPIFKYLVGVAAVIILGTVTACDLLIPAPPSPPTPTATQTEMPTPTTDWFPATPTPTVPPEATPTPQPTPIDQREGVAELLIDDNFTDQDLWSLTQSSSGNVTLGTENLTLAVARSGTSLISNSQHPVPVNFYLEITIEPRICQPLDQYGIIFLRESEGDYYRLLLNCAGQYRLEVAQGGNVTVLEDWETASRMQPGAPASNRFGLWVNRGDFQLYINDSFQFIRRIPRDRSGGIGVYARTINGDALTVRFLDLQIYRVETR